MLHALLLHLLHWLSYRPERHYMRHRTQRSGLIEG